MKKLIPYLLIMQLVFSNQASATASKEKVSPAIVGWGNLFVPGLGATLQDQPVLGLTEAALELGSFYGGTSLGRETRFEIDGSISSAAYANVGKLSAARILQQFGLKYHFYNTFYHYQQAAIESEDTEREKNNPQPLYRGTWKDILQAPFQWNNLKSNWTWPIVIGVSGFLIADYAHSAVKLRKSGISGTDQLVYGVCQVGAIPVGSSFGEDPLFRGFIEREVRGSTNSLALAVLSESALFAALHENYISSFAVGAYFGIEADALKGDLGPMMAAHFWINVVLGAIDYFQMQRSIQKNTPFNPPVITSFTFPI